MMAAAHSLASPAPPRARWAVVLAAATMVATLPGRTHGLGLVTEPLMADLHIDRVTFATLNFWATMLGASFCLPMGRIIDRCRTSGVLAASLAALGGVVVAMSAVRVAPTTILLPDMGTTFALGRPAMAAVPAVLFVLVMLTRGLGQSGLSVVGLAVLGRAAGDRPGRLVGVYSCLVAIGFMIAFLGAKTAFERGSADWRQVWAGIGWCLLAFAAVSPWLVRLARAQERTGGPGAEAGGSTLREALRTPAFWAFGMATALYGLVASGLSLFNQSLLAERGFDRGVFLTATAAAPLVGLAANLGGGWLAGFVSPGRIAAAGLALQGGALAAFPLVRSSLGVYAYAAVMALAGGLLTVVFFGFWRQAYGATHLGAVQSVAQALTVVASALGPVVLATGQRSAGSYIPVMLVLAGLSALLGLVVALVPVPGTARVAEVPR
jgi:hypothetical protein